MVVLFAFKQVELSRVEVKDLQRFSVVSDTTLLLSVERIAVTLFFEELVHVVP